MLVMTKQYMYIVSQHLILLWGSNVSQIKNLFFSLFVFKIA